MSAFCYSGGVVFLLLLARRDTVAFMGVPRLVLFSTGVIYDMFMSDVNTR